MGDAVKYNLTKTAPASMLRPRLTLEHTFTDLKKNVNKGELKVEVGTGTLYGPNNLVGYFGPGYDTWDLSKA